MIAVIPFVGSVLALALKVPFKALSKVFRMINSARKLNPKKLKVAEKEMAKSMEKIDPQKMSYMVKYFPKMKLALLKERLFLS